MPTWLTVVIGVAAGLTALATVWRLLIRPTAELIVLQQSALPLLRVLVRVFATDPGRLDVLDDIAKEFRTNNGSTLRDVVNRLDAAAAINANAAEVLRIEVEATRQLAVQDREHLSRLLIHLDRLNVKVERVESQGGRLEAAAAVVAVDLADSHARADAVEGHAGEAADAASRSADE